MRAGKNSLRTLCALASGLMPLFAAANPCAQLPYVVGGEMQKAGQVIIKDIAANTYHRDGRVVVSMYSHIDPQMAVRYMGTCQQGQLAMRLVSFSGDPGVPKIRSLNGYFDYQKLTLNGENDGQEKFVIHLRGSYN